MQDYHRFHFLTGATLTSITNVPGRLYTVNPIAINSPFADVLTQNKRAICMFETPQYGPVAFVVIGATMVSAFSLHAFAACDCLSATSVINPESAACDCLHPQSDKPGITAFLLSQRSLRWSSVTGSVTAFCYLSGVQMYTAYTTKNAELTF